MRLSKKLQKQVEKLSPGEKVELALQMFGAQVETDNYNQIIIFTGMKYASSKVDIIRRMKDKDF